MGNPLPSEVSKPRACWPLRKQESFLVNEELSYNLLSLSVSDFQLVIIVQTDAN